MEYINCSEDYRIRVVRNLFVSARRDLDNWERLEVRGCVLSHLHERSAKATAGEWYLRSFVLP